MNSLVYFLDSWSSPSSSPSSSSSSCSRSSSRHFPSLVQLADDRIANCFQLLLLVLEFVRFSQLVGVQPLDRFITLVIDLLPVIRGNLVLQLLIVKGRLHVEAIGFKAILSIDFYLLLF